MTNDVDTIITTVINCARCGEEHKDMKFWKFTVNPITDTDGTVWEYWSTCLVTDEPVFMKVGKDIQ